MTVSFALNHSTSSSSYAFADENNRLELIAHERSLSRQTLNELHCYLSMQPSPDGQHCEATWDGVSCWPQTKLLHSASIPCFEELKGIAYDTTQNATRVCLENGNWADRADYSGCVALLPEEDILKRLWNVSDASTIYQVGYGISLVALFLALIIFMRFQELGCMRNRIHTQLIFTYLFMDVSWIIAASLQAQPQPTELAGSAQCLLFISLTYLIGTNFFWMFVEGLYLYLLVVQTFQVERLQLPHYAFIGWGVPALLLAIWLPLKYAYAQTGNLLVCPWSERDFLDYVFILPILIVLALNVYFLLVIMYVLITKLRASTSAESQQYRKAAKALLVLIPLLGLTYVLLLVTPTGGQAKVIFTYLQAALYSTQGLLVAVLYCFLNGEVRHCIQSHLHRWNTVRILLHSRRAVSVRGSNASQTTGDETNGVPHSRYNLSGFGRSSLETQEFGETREYRLPLKTTDCIEQNGSLVNTDFHNRQPQQQQQLVDLLGRTRTVRSCYQSPRLSLSKRFLNLFYRCRWTTTNQSPARLTFGSVRTNPSAYRSASNTMAHSNSNVDVNSTQKIEQKNLNCHNNDKGEQTESGKPLSLTTKISIEINCNPKPLYAYSPVQVSYSEQPL